MIGGCPLRREGPYKRRPDSDEKLLKNTHALHKVSIIRDMHKFTVIVMERSKILAKRETTSHSRRRLVARKSVHQ